MTFIPIIWQRLMICLHESISWFSGSSDSLKPITGCRSRFISGNCYATHDSTHTVDGSPSAFLRLCSSAFQPLGMRQEAPLSNNTIWFVCFCLQHTLPDICLGRLAEGRYLIVHKAGEPFVALMKEVGGKVTRGSYNLQQVHGSVPRPPASGAIPWIPVDPAVVLPFHQRHGRIPCSFPVTNVLKVTKVPRKAAPFKVSHIYNRSFTSDLLVLMDVGWTNTEVSFYKSNNQSEHRSSSTGFICADREIHRTSVRNSTEQK